ncbi:hypothetical protein THAOC_35616 [Thalassiosira oceanica]|uniref:Gamma carbonic anhydrase n=1 Tax=Thalassiosira oceanica TaxID=159749 RepID=K0R9Z2_THAOC|nr:hypothetical protein THAOC_35616 [Thalassiosira oceanica]|eukprot:EJK45751.1 hypothetical protein THAOC_35616 [Thalassiosira oceanica]
MPAIRGVAKFLCRVVADDLVASNKSHTHLTRVINSGQGGREIKAATPGPEGWGDAPRRAVRCASERRRRVRKNRPALAPPEYDEINATRESKQNFRFASEARHISRSSTPSKMKGVYRLGAHVPKIGQGCWIAPTAAVVGHVIMEEQSSVWFGAVVRGDNPEPITIGSQTNVQDGAVLHADRGVPLKLGAGVTVGHQAMLHGCTIHDNTLVGIGATVLNHSVVGKNCVIGAHALIPERKTIPDNSLVVGSPGKVVRQLSDEQIEGLKKSASHYVNNQQWFSEALQELIDDDETVPPRTKL